MKAVLLDADTLGDDIDLSPIRRLVDELIVYPATTPEQLHTHLADADLILTNKVFIPAEVMSGRAAILVLATGINNVDLDAARASRLPVMNVRNYGTASVAQHTMMLMLALAARLPCYQQDLSAGAWQRSAGFCMLDHRTLELRGKLLVLVGAGDLGSKVAELARSFGMQVIFTARPGAEHDSRPDLDAVLPKADVLSFHCPLNEHTHHLLNAERISRMNPDCLVINCARGGIIDEEAALTALQAGRMGGLAVDVLPAEPPIDGHPLLAALNQGYNLIVTPHTAWISPEARQNVIDLTAQNIRQLLNRKM